MSASKLFLSHASQDRPVADLLRETLILGGVPNEAIFYSSNRGTGIPSGTDVRGHLKAELQQAGLVVELITSTFLTRPMCLMELGGAWALDVATYPIVLPPLEHAKVAQQIGDVHMGLLGSDSDIDDVFDELHDRLGSDLDLRTPFRTWNSAIRGFKSRFPTVLSESSATIGQSAASSSKTSPRPAAPPAVTSNPRISLSNIGTSGTGTSSVIHGEATNNSTAELSAILKAVFYDNSGGIAGTFDGTVMQVAPGETKAFAISTFSSFPEHDRINVQVDTIM